MSKYYKRYPKFGETVKVFVDPTEPSARSIVQFNGLITKVNGVSRGPIYTLDGCNVNGLPYWFVHQWLTVIKEG